MDARLAPLASILRTNTRLMLNCLEGVDDEAGLVRPSARANHMTFIAAHLVGARAYLAGALGGNGTDPFGEALGPVSSIDEVESFPTLDEIRVGWRQVTARLQAALDEVTPEDLDGEAPTSFPIDDPTLLGMAAFLTQHDAYHIGQLGLLRKHVGRPAMSYT